jgi:rubrerythrin
MLEITTTRCDIKRIEDEKLRKRPKKRKPKQTNEAKKNQPKHAKPYDIQTQNEKMEHKKKKKDDAQQSKQTVCVMCGVCGPHPLPSPLCYNKSKKNHPNSLEGPRTESRKRRIKHFSCLAAPQASSVSPALLAPIPSV